MKDKTLIIKTILILAGIASVVISVSVWVISLFVDKIKEFPLPNHNIFIQAIISIALGFLMLYALDKITERVKETFNVEIVKRVVLTIMLISTVYIPLFYGYFGWLPSLLGQRFAYLEERWLLLMLSVFFFLVVGSFYYLISQIWPDVGKIKLGIFLSSVTLTTVLIISLWQVPYRLFNRDGTSNVMYNPNDFQPYFHLRQIAGQDLHDERGGAKLIKLTLTTDPAVIQKIQQKIPKIQNVLMFWKWGEEEAEAKIPPQITPQTSYGWKVDSNGKLVASLQTGEEASRVFRMSEGYSTPWFVLPPKGYRFRADYQQAVIVEEKGRGKKIIRPNDTDNRGVTQGTYREFRFTALKGGAEIIITLRRVKV